MKLSNGLKDALLAQLIVNFRAGRGAASYTGYRIRFFDSSQITVSPFVTGSVGTLGSGADLEIADKNIVAGQQYKSFGFNFYVPSINTVI